jgi:hypothetical protein
MRMTLLLILTAALGVASTIINSGTVTTNRGDQIFAGWVAQISGPGIQFGGWHNLTEPPLGVPLCEGTCTDNFSGRLAGARRGDHN